MKYLSMWDDLPRPKPRRWPFHRLSIREVKFEFSGKIIAWELAIVVPRIKSKREVARDRRLKEWYESSEREMQKYLDRLERYGWERPTNTWARNWQHRPTAR